jgi:TatD DNase family protein
LPKQEDLKIIEKFAKNEKCVAIGEIGLDYFYDHSPRDVQARVLREQLALAVEFDLPVSFHVREAFDDFWPIFDEFTGVKGVMVYR